MPDGEMCTTGSGATLVLLYFGRGCGGNTVIDTVGPGLDEKKGLIAARRYYR